MYYNLLINTRVANKRTNLGNIYLEKKYISTTIIVNVNATSLIKKKGTSCGIKIKLYKVVTYIDVNHFTIKTYNVISKDI